jgi:tetratricopeptide (TPR) repeat protein
MLAEAQEMFKAKRFAEAEVLLREVCEQGLRRPRAGVLLAESLLALGKEEEAEAVLKQTIKDRPQAPGPRRHLARIFEKRGAYDEVVATLEGIAGDRGALTDRLLLTRAFLKLDRVRRAAEELRKVEAPWPKPFPALAKQVVLKLALGHGSMAGADFLEVARGACADLARFDQNLAHVLNKEARACWLENKLEQAAELLKLVVSVSSLLQASPESALHLAEIHIGDENYFEATAVLALLNDFTEEEVCKKRDWLLLLCQEDFSKPVDIAAKGTENLFVPTEQLFSGALQHYRFGSERCVVWFNGAIAGNAVQQLTKALPVLRRRGISVLAITDKRRFMAMGGVGPYFPDRAATREAIQAELAARGYYRLAMVGSSGTGLSALLYGAEMAVEGILGFAAVTRLPEEGRDTNPQALKHRARLLGNIKVIPSDSRELVAQASRTAVFLVFPEFSEFDAQQTENLADLANVTLWPEPFDKHSVCLWLLEQDLFTKRLETFLDSIGW